jgi:hypothetical protein
MCKCLYMKRGASLTKCTLAACFMHPLAWRYINVEARKRECRLLQTSQAY